MTTQEAVTGADGMETAHEILLVEDNPEMAEEICDRLKMMGYRVRLASNGEEAEREINRGGFCLVILDLHLRLHGRSMVADIEVGYVLLRRLREKFSMRTAGGKFVLQIIVISGHAKTRAYLRKAFQLDANDFIVKPFSENEVSLEDAIRQCLRKAERVDHKECVAATSKPAGNSSAAAGEGGPIVEVRVTGRPDKKRLEIVIGGKTVSLRPSELVTMLTLHLGQLEQGTARDGWMDRGDIDSDESRCWKAIQLLRDRVGPALDFDAVENQEGRKRYRLSPRLKVVSIDFDALLADGDARLTAVVRGVQAVLAPGESSEAPPRTLVGSSRSSATNATSEKLPRVSASARVRPTAVEAQPPPSAKRPALTSSAAAERKRRALAKEA